MAVSVSPAQPVDIDRPIDIDPGKPTVDKVFHWSSRAVAGIVLLIFGAIGVFLAYQGIPTFHRYGIKFFTSSIWTPGLNKLGLSSSVLGTAKVAIVALVIAFPLALACALYISEFSPGRAKRLLVGLVDLMAAVPSVIYGIWGELLLQPHLKLISRWLNEYLGWIPIFRVHANSSSATWQEAQFVGSEFIAAVCVSMMVIPIACSVMRGVFDQAPIGEREAAYALGSTRWGMVRTVVLPFGRGGVVGGTMLGLGRALGETVAVLLILQQNFNFNFRILQNGGSTISRLIANDFGDSSHVQKSALLTAGFVLFVLTLVVNTIAGAIISRSRSGAATEI